MKLSYTTEKLPQHFITLGYLLTAAGVWVLLVEDWKGILFLLAGIILIFIESGIVIDPVQKALKQYTGIFFLKRGKWKSIETSVRLSVVRTPETQTMHVLSISRSITDDVYKLWLLMPDENIELMAGPRDKILARAETISQALEKDLVIEE